MATHSIILAWRIPRTEDPAGYSPQVAESDARLSTARLPEPGAQQSPRGGALLLRNSEAPSRGLAQS